MNVSILTITQLSRHESFKLLIDYIQNQTYKNIVEWIIIDGSSNVEDAHCNKTLIDNLNISYPNIIYQYNSDIPNKPNKIELIKNISNDINGDILINMDDDDYYFPSFIEYIVSKLYNSSKTIAASDFIYIHDLILNKTFKMNPGINPIAFKKSFNINDEVELLLSEYLMIKMLHNNNHYFNKAQIYSALVTNINKLEDEIIKYLIPEKYYEQYKDIFNNNINDLEYDIVYFAGGFGIKWSPYDINLGGSEQAIVYLSEEFAKQGKKIIVYGNFDYIITKNNVQYDNWINFPFNKKQKTIILWRKSGILSFMTNNLNADNIIIDLHDNMFVFNDLNKIDLINFLKKVNYIFLKSEFHKESFIKYFDNELNNKIIIIPNGIRINEFLENKENYIKQPYRFCYCSSYDRGLEYILKYIWPYIYEAESTAELHLYYGMDYIYDDNFKNKMSLLIGSTKGVMYHGRQSIDKIIREKYLSTFQLYICLSDSEIDCINIKESLVCNCIPIISNYGVFKERHGLQYQIDEMNINADVFKAIAYDIINKMKDNIYIENACETLKTSNTIISWNNISNEWIKYI